MKKIIIGVCTYNRIQLLKECLDSLGNMLLPQGYDITVVIADNSFDKNAEKTYTESKNKLQKERLQFSYLSVTRQGISFPRNAILQYSKDTDADYLAFIDDDETADKDWIFNLVAFTDKNDLDCVNGFVQYKYSDTAPKWMKHSNAHGGPRNKKKPTGSTNNIIYNLHYLKQHKLSYEETYALSGGEDTFLFKQILNSGGRCGYCPDAVTYESVHTERESLAWLCKRFFNNGLVGVHQDKTLHRKSFVLKLLLKKLWYGTTRGIYYLMECIFSRNPATFIYSVKCIFILSGYFFGYFFGLKLKPYAK